LEKIVGKSKLPTLLGDTLSRPAGLPSMVDVNDPRPELVIKDQLLKQFDNLVVY
jgi:hypothetical protein